MKQQPQHVRARQSCHGDCGRLYFLRNVWRVEYLLCIKNIIIIIIIIFSGVAKVAYGEGQQKRKSTGVTLRSLILPSFAAATIHGQKQEKQQPAREEQHPKREVIIPGARKVATPYRFIGDEVQGKK